MSTSDIKRIKVWIVEKGSGKPDSDPPIELNVSQTDIKNPFEYDIWADWLSDGIEREKVGSVSFKYPYLKPEPGEISIDLRYSPTTVHKGDRVYLDASRTTPSQSDAHITYWHWVVRNEFGIKYPVIDEDKPLASFVYPNFPKVEVILVVEDSVGKNKTANTFIEASDIPPVNKPPVANAGVDQIVEPLSTVTLNASGSYDPDGDNLVYKWTQIGGENVTLNNSTSAVTTFKAPNLETPQDPVAVLFAPSTAEGGANVILDAGQSIGDTVEISQISGDIQVILRDISDLKKEFTAPNQNVNLGFQAVAKIGNKISTTQIAIQISKSGNGGGEIDEFGISWLEARGKQVVIEQSRDRDNDDRWSGNVTGLADFVEATFIGKSIDIASDGHFAMKIFGGNHSRGDWKRMRWYDFGLRANGDIQIQWEGVGHPDNHDVDLPKVFWFIKNIGKGLEGNWIGLKWIVKKLKKGGSPEDGGVRCRMWVDTDPLDDNGKPRNNWKLCFDFIDGIDVEVIDPQSYSAPDEQDCEVRRSDTKRHEVYAGGLHVRKLGDAKLTSWEEAKKLYHFTGINKPHPLKVTAWDRDNLLPKCDPSQPEEVPHENMLKTPAQYKAANPSLFINKERGKSTIPFKFKRQPLAIDQKELKFEVRVTDPEGASDTDTVTITVKKSDTTNQPPIADIVYSPERPTAGQQVTLDGRGSHDVDGTISAYYWDTSNPHIPITDPTSSMASLIWEQNLTSTDVSLTVKDNEGASGFKTTTIHAQSTNGGEEWVLGQVGDTHGRSKGEDAIQEIFNTPKFRFMVHTGDITDTESDDDGYISFMRSVGGKYGENFANAQGNHESSEEGGRGAQRDMENAYPVLEATNWLQFYHINNAVVIIGNTQLDNYSHLDSEAGKWLIEQLKKAKQLVDSGQADWIFYFQHKPVWTLKARHASEYNFRYNFHPLFDQYGVDIFGDGHNHDMQRTLPIIYVGASNTPPKINNKMKGDAHDFTTLPHGIIVAINGSSSKNSDINDSNAWTTFAEDNENGYNIYKIKGKNLIGQYIRTSDKKVLHEFKVTKE